MNLTFETKVWENDWKFILKGDYLERMISNCNYEFSKKHIIVNNVKNRKLIEKYCNLKLKKGVIDAYYFVEDYSEKVLNHFNIDFESFNGGYVYSISELVGIYLCETEFLLHFSSDSLLRNNNYNWIKEAINCMNKNSTILVANPTWNYHFLGAKNESTSEIDNFYIGSGFSDQCYLIRTEDFNKKIYSEKNKSSERYPKYGGELFEKRIDSYMKNNSLLRITHKEDAYVSRNFPKNWFLKNVFKKIIIFKRLY